MSTELSEKKCSVLSNTQEAGYFAFGLRWEKKPSGKYLTEIKNVHGKQFGCTNSSDKGYNGAFSFGSFVADTIKNGVGAYFIGDEEGWGLVAVSAGLVIPGFDKVVPFEKIAEFIEDSSSFVEEGVVLFNGRAISDGSVLEFFSSYDYSVSDLEDAKFGDHRLRKASFNFKLLIFPFIVLAAFFANEYWNSTLRLEIEQSELSAKLAEDQIRQDGLLSLRKNLSSLIESRSPESSLRIFEFISSKLPFSFSGWILSEANIMQRAAVYKRAKSARVDSVISFFSSKGFSPSISDEAGNSVRIIVPPFDEGAGDSAVDRGYIDDLKSRLLPLTDMKVGVVSDLQSLEGDELSLSFTDSSLGWTDFDLPESEEFAFFFVRVAGKINMLRKAMSKMTRETSFVASLEINTSEGKFSFEMAYPYLKTEGIQ